MLMRAQAQGSGTHHAEVELRQMLDYGEVQQTVASGEMQAWTGCLSARNLAGAQALLTTGSTFAKNMRRASLFAASGASKPVPKTEPCRAELNDSIRNFDALSGEQTRLATLRCLPGEADLLAPAIDETRKKLLGFANATGEQSVNIMIQVAGMLLPEARCGVGGGRARAKRGEITSDPFLICTCGTIHFWEPGSETRSITQTASRSDKK